MRPEPSPRRCSGDPLDFTQPFDIARASGATLVSDAVWYTRCNDSGGGHLEAAMKRCTVTNQNTQSLLAAVENKSTAVRALRGVAALAVALSVAGCYARGSGGARAQGSVVYSAPVVAVEYDEPVVVVQTVPAEIESYPRHTYRNSNVFLVEGQWYWRSGGRWVAYRTEPRALASVRVSYEAKYGRHYRPGNANASPRPKDKHDKHDNRGHRD